MRKMNINEVCQFIQSQDEETKVYIGADSERVIIDEQWHADYTLVVVVHISGKHGCKVFGEIQRERDFDQKQNRPSMRLMTEVMKVAELFHKLQEVLIDKEVEIHLDLNPNKIYGSSCVVEQAIGYIRGTCNVIPLVKPNSWAASHCADRLKSIIAA